METETVTISSLIPDPANVRVHKPKNLDAIKGSLTRFGQQKPIVVDAKGVVVAGNGTLEAAKALGWDKIAVVRTSLEGPDATAFAIADNRTGELAEWDPSGLGAALQSLKDIDFDFSAIGFDEKDLANLIPERVQEGLCDEDDVPEVTDTVCKPGDLWLLGNHRLLCGDSTNVQHVERLMGGEKADMVFTSPPYFDQRDYNGGKDLTVENLKQFISSFRASTDLFIVNLGIKRSNGSILRYWDEYITYAEQCDLKLLSWNVWDRSGEGGSIGAMTAQFPIQHEFIFVLGNLIETNRFIPNKSAGRETKTTIRGADGSLRPSHWKAHDFGNLGTVLKTDIDKGKSDIKHPAKFPVSLPENYILACTSEMEVIAEPFTGSGSTLIACEKTNRKCRGMEIDPHYCDVIIARWEKFTGKKAALVTGEKQGG